MANVRMAGRRVFAAFAISCCLVAPCSARADENPAPFVEYEGDGKWSPLMAQAASWMMQATCAWEGFSECVLLDVKTSVLGYVFHYQHTVWSSGGEPEVRIRDSGGISALSCPADFDIYVEVMGMAVGPFPNREIGIDSPWPVTCQARGHAARDASALHVKVPQVEEAFDSEGRLVERLVRGGDPVAWSVAWDATGAEVVGRGDAWTLRATIDRGRAVSLGQLRLAYGTEGELEAVYGVGGTVLGRGSVSDPDGRLAAELREIRSHLPEGPAPAPLDALSRAAAALDTLLQPHATP